ncbi:uncharacterized protein LOC123698432 isoform X1 [Colias croceus]|uniref:uncharacterized protein LOC123698432 isoform X1 n=1 Tax=Colias crocea TaxID=72248 RepID=UPI001E27B854|nr:uncharacterized protein LOC123698432 isoform X1 [Colias croceus]
MAMFYENDDGADGHFDPQLFQVVRRELYAISTDFNTTHYNVYAGVPTHTEDGIPIRKLYVSNLPPKTTRTELFGIFAQYGFIKSCWLRMGDKGPNKVPTPTYAFVTYSDPAHAHKALTAPLYEKILRGRHLRISPADSWHQPAEDTDGRVRWKPRGESGDIVPTLKQNESEQNTEESEQTETVENAENTESTSKNTEEETEDDSYNMLDVLNRDCLTQILGYVPIVDLIRSERVSKKWQNMVHEYLQGIRTFKTSWWQHAGMKLTTAVLRRVLQRFGSSLLRLHIDHHWSALNDRTAHTVGKFCPNLEEVKVVGMHTKNWNPLIYGCKQLKCISFISCNKLTDSSLVHVVKNDTSIEKLTVTHNTHVTGLFLTASQPLKLTSLSFYNCYSLQGTVLSSAMVTLPNLTTLKLDVCPVTMWKIIPLILNKLPQLEELSLSEYTSVGECLTPMGNEAFCESIANLTELKRLNLSRNIYINNAVLKQVAQTCQKLESLNISSCNSRKSFSYPGVGDEGLIAVCSACTSISFLNVSYLAAVSDVGMAAIAKLKRLQTLISRGNSTITASPFTAILNNCHYLEEIDLCGCDSVTEEVISPAAKMLDAHPRLLVLRLAGTSACADGTSILIDNPTHKLLAVNLHEDLSNPHMRPDFVDRVFEDSSDESFDDLYDHEDFNDIIGHMLSSDEELYLDEDLVDYDGVFEYGLHDNIILF